MFPVYSPDIGSLFRGSPVYIAGMFRWDVIAPRIASSHFISPFFLFSHAFSLSLSLFPKYHLLHHE